MASCTLTAALPSGVKPRMSPIALAIQACPPCEADSRRIGDLPAELWERVLLHCIPQYGRRYLCAADLGFLIQVICSGWPCGVPMQPYMFGQMMAKTWKACSGRASFARRPCLHHMSCCSYLGKGQCLGPHCSHADILCCGRSQQHATNWNRLLSEPCLPLPAGGCTWVTLISLTSLAQLFSRAGPLRYAPSA